MISYWFQRVVPAALLLIALPCRAEEAIDLGAELGGAPSALDFQPYVFERSELWILFPLAMLVLLTLHLLPVPRLKIRKLTLRNDFFGQPEKPQSAPLAGERKAE